jgi:phosphoglycerate dehydrogenase-like enzyme
VEEQYGVEYSPLPMLLKASDFVSLHVPLIDSTRNMIDAGALSSMKSGAYLINLKTAVGWFGFDANRALSLA